MLFLQGRENIQSTTSLELLKKVFSLYWEDTSKIRSGYCSFFFQKKLPFSKGGTDFKNLGWIHRDTVPDRNKLSGVLYLTPDANLETGTTVYRIKKEVEESLLGYAAWKKVNESNKLLFTKKNEYFSEDGLEEIKTNLEEWNSCFEAVTQVNNIYNRLISFDANDWHAATNSYTGDQERLSIVYFIDNVKGATMPKDRVVKDNLTEIINATNNITI